MSKISEIQKNSDGYEQNVGSVVNSWQSVGMLYNLAFIKEDDGGWYIDLPEWQGAHADLEMVAGSNLLLDYLLKVGNRVVLEVIKSNEALEDLTDYIRCEQVNASLTGGSTYNVFGLDDFNHTIWICPVTLFVLGEYPKYIYIRQTK